jgi:hypothetical protein
MTARQHRGRPFLRSGRGRTAAGQVRARTPAESEGTNSGPEPPEPARQIQAKEVFEMAASLSIEEESGTYTARFSHPHNGYYAGDFSQPSQAGSELRTSYTECRDLPRLGQ